MQQPVLLGRLLRRFLRACLLFLSSLALLLPLALPLVCLLLLSSLALLLQLARRQSLLPMVCLLLFSSLVLLLHLAPLP